jgi:hypothetical protein
MLQTTFTSRDFLHKTGLAKKATADGPVFITDRGETKYVFLSFDDYTRLNKPTEKLSDAIALDVLYDAFEFKACGSPTGVDFL